MRLLVCLSILVLVRGAPVPDDADTAVIVNPVLLPDDKAIKTIEGPEDKDVILTTEPDITLPTEKPIENKEKWTEDKEKDVEVTPPTEPEVILITENPVIDKENGAENKPNKVILPSEQGKVPPKEKPEDFLDGQVVILLAFFADLEDDLAAPGAPADHSEHGTEVSILPAPPEEKNLTHLEGDAVFMQWAD